MMDSNSTTNPRVIPETQAYSLEPEEVGSQLSPYIPGPSSPDPRYMSIVRTTTNTQDLP